MAQGMWLAEYGGGQSLRVPCERIGRTEAMARGEEPWGQDQGSWLWFCGTGPAAGIPTIDRGCAQSSTRWSIPTAAKQVLHKRGITLLSRCPIDVCRKNLRVTQITRMPVLPFETSGDRQNTAANHSFPGCP